MDMDHDLQVSFFRAVAHWLYARAQELELREPITLVGQLDADAECWRIIKEHYTQHPCPPSNSASTLAHVSPVYVQAAGPYSSALPQLSRRTQNG